MKYSVIVPVYNEKSTIKEIIRQIREVDLDKEIIIVDDGSTDGTEDILKDNFSNQEDLQLIFLEKNHGKGFAIRKALEHIKGDIIIMQDADLEYNPQDYKKLVKPILDGRVSVVYGSRFINLNKFAYMCNWIRSKLSNTECKIGHLYFSNFLGIQLLNFIVRILYGAKITDEATCYKVFKKEVINKINLKSIKFEFCPEITAKVLKMGYKIVEVPISYYPRTAEHGKKIGARDGLAAIITLIKYRFVN